MIEEKNITDDKYKLLFKFNPLPSWIFDIDSLRIFDVNEAAIKNYGFSRQEFLSMSIKDLRPDKELPKLEKDLQSIEDAEDLVKLGTFVHKRKDGELRKVEVHGHRFRLDEHNCRLVVCNDITEKEKALQKLKEKEAKLLTAQRIAKLGSWELNLETQRLTWSNEAFEIWGRKKEDFYPTFENVSNTVHPEDVEIFQKENIAAKEGLQELDVEYRILLPDESIKWIHGRGKIIDTLYDGPRIFEGTVQDITERKVADIKLQKLNKNLKNYTNELVAANKGLEQFSFIVSHNLRAPVANIKGLVDLIQNDDYPAEIKENLLNEVFNNVKRLDNVIADLNAILHVKKAMDEPKELVHFLELVEDIKSSIQTTIEQEKVEIRTNFDAAPQILSVKSYLHSIFYNLISNSIKYRKPDIAPVIEITSVKEEDQVILTFQDNGLGMDLEKKSGQLFGLYKRFHEHVDGKGLGLFMVKTQVEILGGKISASSKINEGMRFRIALREE